jgi:hypothetical protein
MFFKAITYLLVACMWSIVLPVPMLSYCTNRDHIGMWHTCYLLLAATCSTDS